MSRGIMSGGGANDCLPKRVHVVTYHVTRFYQVETYTTQKVPCTSRNFRKDYSPITKIFTLDEHMLTPSEMSKVFAAII